MAEVIDIGKPKKKRLRVNADDPEGKIIITVPQDREGAEVRIRSDAGDIRIEIEGKDIAVSNLLGFLGMHMMQAKQLAVQRVLRNHPIVGPDGKPSGIH